MSMARLSYAAITSLDGYVEDDAGKWGAALAAHALRADLVDDVQLLSAPVIVGGGKRALPDRLHQNLELVDERRFSSCFVYLGYRVIVELSRVPLVSSWNRA